jgi:hypothetical protein
VAEEKCNKGAMAQRTSRSINITVFALHPGVTIFNKDSYSDNLGKMFYNMVVSSLMFPIFGRI